MTRLQVKLQETMYRLVLGLAGRMGVSMADVIREAVSFYGWAAHECEEGNRLLVQRGDEVTEIVIPNLQRLRPEVAPCREVVGAPPLRRGRASATKT